MRSWITLFGPALAWALAALLTAAASANENYESWEILKNPFESTGGGGVMIGEYNPVIVGNRCVTNFTATLPDGKVYYNIVEFETVAGPGRDAVHQRQVARPRRQRLRHHAIPRLHQGRRRAPLALSGEPIRQACL